MAQNNGSVVMEWDAANMTALLNSPQVARFCHKQAEQVAATARGFASGISKTGAYAASIHVEDEKHPTRPASLVMADAPHALKVESRYGILARARNANRIA